MYPLLSFVVLFASARTPAAAEPLLDLVSSQQYVTVSDPTRLPIDVERGLADRFGNPLRLAAANEPFNGSCVVDPRKPRARLLIVALGTRFAVVHLQTGGFVPANRLFILARDRDHARVLWSGTTPQILTEPGRFVAALRNRSIWLQVREIPR
jgi:hypothetical protein